MYLLHLHHPDPANRAPQMLVEPEFLVALGHHQEPVHALRATVSLKDLLKPAVFAKASQRRLLLAPSLLKEEKFILRVLLHLPLGQGGGSSVHTPFLEH